MRCAVPLRTFAGLFFAAGLFALTAVPVMAQTSPSAYTYATRYDAANRVTGTIAPDPDGTGALKFAATRTTYDASGRVTRVESGELATWQAQTVAPSAWTGFTLLSSVETTYDTLDRKVREETRDANGAATALMQYSYDGAGRADCVAQRMNPARGAPPPFAIQPAEACDLNTAGTFGPDRITKNSYDAMGQLLKVQRALGTPLQQDYATYTYTLNGKQASVTDANGNRTGYTYDGFDRLKRWSFPSKTTPGQTSTTDYEDYGYDANGNRTSLRKRDGSVLTYAYDSLNRVTRKTVPERAGLAATHTRDVFYGYDLRGLQTHARFDSGSGEGVALLYDGFGRLAGSIFSMDGAARQLTNTFDANGNRISFAWPDGTYLIYSHDGLDRLTGIVNPANIQMAGYSYSNRGLLLAQTNGSPTTLGYDPAGRLTSLSHDTGGTAQDVSYGYGYTPALQIASRTTSIDAYAFPETASSRNYTVNGLNQYSAVGGTAHAYDANGNLTSDGSSTYTYDIENRLVSASGATTATLRYDPLGRLYEVTGTTGTTRFLYDGDELVAEYSPAGTLLRRYIHGLRSDDPVALYEGSSMDSAGLRFLKANHQGSIVAVTGSTGTVSTLNSYDDYGIPASSNATIAQGGRFQYTGQAWLPELKLYHYKARLYAPQLGRFLQTDPVGYDDGLNLYAYVGNDPVGRIDPNGTSDLNLFDSDDFLYSSAKNFNVPHVYTITGHGGDKGIIDNRGGGRKEYNAQELLNQAKGYRGGLTFLASCSLAAIANPRDESGSIGRSFAQAYADVSKGSVIATAGFVIFPSTNDTIGKPYKDGDPVTLRANSKVDGSGTNKQFYLYSPGGNSPVAIGNKVTINAKTGVATWSGAPKVGSRIAERKSACVDESKCGK
jgi:RHS repeat-associated protein